MCVSQELHQLDNAHMRCSEKVIERRISKFLYLRAALFDVSFELVQETVIHRLISVQKLLQNFENAVEVGYLLRLSLLVPLVLLFLLPDELFILYESFDEDLNGGQSILEVFREFPPIYLYVLLQLLELDHGDGLLSFF